MKDLAQDPVATLLQSEKFLNWKPSPAISRRPVHPDIVIHHERVASPRPDPMEEHLSPAQLAKVWGVDVETIRNIFRVEPGVVKIGEDAKRKTLRIPRSVAVRVHTRLCS
jgi:hypothetical protein